ncbi:NAD(P)/FAD-dependent oxidoreductase [Microbacteriaceae bacterium 4G12]
MDLQSGLLYWLTTFKDPPSYPSLEEDIECDVLIIGGGISGAQCAYYFSETDLDIVVVDKRKIGYGSTCANTALIQYLSNKMAFELVNSFGEDHAIRHLRLCEEAINEIERAAASMNIDSEFTRRNSLYYASYEEDVQKLKKDYGYLQKHNFAVEFLTEEQIGALYPFKKRAALYVKNDGELNPYKFTIGLLEQARAKGVRVFEQTEINGKKLEQDAATFYTNTKHSIKAKHVIIAAGYEGLEFKMEKNAVLSSTYAVITNPVEDFTDWHKRTLIWETARPYIYMRTTADNRIIIGGLDEDIISPKERDAKLMHKKDKLIREFNELFPNIKAHPEFYLAAHFGATHDGLPILGMYGDMPNCYFIFGYGDNGILYNMVLAKLVRDLITEGSHPDLDIYLQTRPMLYSL